MKRESSKSTKVSQVKLIAEEKRGSAGACNFADNYYGDRVCMAVEKKEG